MYINIQIEELKERLVLTSASAGMKGGPVTSTVTTSLGRVSPPLDTQQRMVTVTTKVSTRFRGIFHNILSITAAHLVTRHCSSPAWCRLTSLMTRAASVPSSSVSPVPRPSSQEKEAAAAQGGDTWHVRLMVAPVRRLSCDTGGTTAGRALQSVLVRVAGAAASTSTRV